MRPHAPEHTGTPLLSPLLRATLSRDLPGGHTPSASARSQHAGWGAAAHARVQVLYDALSGGAEAPSFASVRSLLEELGVPQAHSAHFVRAMARSPVDGQEGDAVSGREGSSGDAARRDEGRRLGFEDFLLGLVAMDPTTAHGGLWNGLRAQYIFRRYVSR